MGGRGWTYAFRRYSNVDILLLAISCICWCTMADSLCIPIADCGGIMPAPADIDPFAGNVPDLLIILPPDCIKAPEESIGLEVVRDNGRGDASPSMSWLGFAADDSAYSGSAGGLPLSVMAAADTGVGCPTLSAAPKPLASRRLALEFARRRNVLKRETRGEGGCCCCQEYEGRSPSEGLRPMDFLRKRFPWLPPAEVLPKPNVKARRAERGGDGSDS